MRRLRRRSTAPAAAVFVLVLVAACGSTVPRGAISAGAGGGGGDASLSDPNLSPSAGGPENPDPSSGTTAGGTPTAGADGQGASTSGATIGGLLAIGKGVHGVTDSTIRIGMVTADAGAVGSITGAISGSNVESTDSYDRANAAVVDLVNSSGGIAGRKVEAVPYFIKAANFFTPSARQQENQRACSTWTEDNQVFAIAALGLTEDIMLECASATQTPLVAVRFGAQVSASQFEAMQPYWYAPHSMVTDRRERAVAKTLIDNEFFGPGAKVALMIEDKPGIREGVERGMKPVLKAAGLAPVVEITYPDFVESPWPNYVLQLQSAGVTHVIWSSMTSPGFAPLFMMRAAESQRYRPMWGGGSDTYPQTLVTLGAPAEQLANLQGMGWKPFWDVNDTSVQSDTAARCSEQLRSYGQSDNIGNLELCESLMFLQAAFSRATEVSPQGLAAGVARLGDKYGSAVTIGGATRFGPGRHDGPSLFRYFVYDRSASRFRYKTEASPLPE